MKKPMTPNGAHFLIIAWRLIFLAALRYLSDSSRSEVDIVDIPVGGGGVSHTVIASRLFRRAGLTVERVTSPKKILHVLGHDLGNVLKVFV